MNELAREKIVGVVGAGAMGIGIAQVAAAAGHPVRLFDTVAGVAEKSLTRLKETVAVLVSKGKLDQSQADALLARITVVSDLARLADAALVVEAIIEDVDIKRKLFADLEAVVGVDAVLATNTSSISVTLIARDLKNPGRFVGMHFFNPAPVMRLVEVVRGVATTQAVADLIHATATAWGKIAVHAKSTPGFIVNRVARAYYSEPLRLYEEGVSDPATMDALLTEGVGFRMGPFALMDLIGNDVNYAVSRSVFDAFYGEPRFRPSNVQLELVNAGYLGRKTGRGFFDYTAGASLPEARTVAQPADTASQSAISPHSGGEIDGVLVLSSEGPTAATVARNLGRPVILLDLIAKDGAKRIAYTASSNVPQQAEDIFLASMAAHGLAATRLPDWPGLVSLRTLALIANEGFEAVLQGVADEAAIDDAMRHGVNYPQGPIKWARQIGLSRLLMVLDTLLDLTGDARYRASYALRTAAALN